ncbi:hypothetical protein GUJ93_ZPchr0010g8394 [Zizania palustris]|uniref:Uncharacterized protein n=1 Tax=Zizania palustris TaxID=103762 RepID=A0A8J5TMA2_ZIZPA|nr:hypothetical protein GUJ93_ZPchr0010g8394 [Zizania palustris]
MKTYLHRRKIQASSLGKTSLELLSPWSTSVCTPAGLGTEVCLRAAAGTWGPLEKAEPPCACCSVALLPVRFPVPNAVRWHEGSNCCGTRCGKSNPWAATAAACSLAESLRESQILAPVRHPAEGPAPESRRFRRKLPWCPLAVAGRRATRRRLCLRSAAPAGRREESNKRKTFSPVSKIEKL